MGGAGNGRPVRIAIVSQNGTIADYDFIAHLTRFCRVLREHGLLVGPQETADAIRAVGHVDIMTEGRIYWSLRSLLVSRQEQLSVFDRLFGQFWNFEPLTRRPEPQADPTANFGQTRTVGRMPRGLGVPEDDPDSIDTVIQLLRTGASGQHVTAQRDLSALAGEDLSELSRIAARMVRALASRPGRRRRRNRRKGVPDLRSAMRLSLSTGGDLIRLPRLRRVPRTPRLMLILDVSGSMDRYARLLLQLAYAVGQHTRRVETFVFSTTVTRVTRELSVPSFSEALYRVGLAVNHWSGGTRIGESLRRINTAYEFLEDRFTTVFLLSDGWETGEPRELAHQLSRMRLRVRSLVWLNPTRWNRRLSTAGSWSTGSDALCRSLRSRERCRASQAASVVASFLNFQLRASLSSPILEVSPVVKERLIQFMKILGICGSLRRESWNLKLLNRAMEAFARQEADTEVFDLNIVPMYHPDTESAEGILPEAERMRQAIRDADAVVVACPEYNSSMTSALKNAFEWASRGDNVLDGKVFFVIGTGPGRSACARMHMHATYSLESESAIVVHQPRVLLPTVSNFMTPDGAITDSSITELLDQAAASVISITEKLS